MSPKEKRKHPRVPAKNVSAHLNVADRSSPCVIQNISAGGLFVETSETMPVGMPVAVNLARPGWSKVLRLTGRVVWAMAPRTAQKRGVTPGMRIKLDALPKPEAKELSALLKDLGAPDGSNPALEPVPAAGLQVPSPDGRVITQPLSLKEIQAHVTENAPALTGPDDQTLLARGGGVEARPSSKPKLSRVELSPTQPSSAPAPAHDSARLIVQVQGLLMQLGDLQQKLEVRDRELEGLRQQLHDKDQVMEKLDRERRAAELAIQRLSMQLAARR